MLSPPPLLKYHGEPATVELDWGCGRSAREERAGELAPPILKIRQMVVHLYLADGSLEIFEKRQVLVQSVDLLRVLLSTAHMASRPEPTRKHAFTRTMGFLCHEELLIASKQGMASEKSAGGSNGEIQCHT